MRTMMAIYKKELKSYFLSPIAYVAISVYICLISLFFTSMISQRLSDMQIVLEFAANFLLIISPLLTMRLIAEEKKLGTDQLLFTSPIHLYKIVIGKYFAAVSVFIIALIITFIYPAILYTFSKIELGPVISGYLGLLLLGSAFFSVGIFVSSLTESQIIASIGTICILFLLIMIGEISNMFSGAVKNVLDYLSITNQYKDFQMGVIGSNHIIYYISVIFVFLFLTLQVLHNGKWSRG